MASLGRRQLFALQRNKEVELGKFGFVLGDLPLPREGLSSPGEQRPTGGQEGLAVTVSEQEQ